MLELVGLSGYARSGKDSVADVLVRDFGFTRVSFAGPMRDALLALNPIVRYEESGYYRIKEVIDVFGWDGYKDSPFGEEVRALLQRFGTEVGREQWGDDFWAGLAIDRALQIIDDGGRVVITDARFVNEAETIQYFGGQVWRVRRPNVWPANGHASETDLDDFAFDDVIDNNGSLEDLRLMVVDRLG